MKSKSTRQSNFELMRIVSMIFIAIWHFLYHGHIIDNTSGVTNNIVMIIAGFLVVHVNSFVLLTGYFNYDKEFKLSKIVKINNQLWFYTLIWVLLAIFAFSISLSKLYIVNLLSFIPKYGNCWFIVIYLALYLVSPALNIVIKNTDKTTHRNIIFALALLSIFSYATCGLFMNITSGYSLFSFVLLYFIGAYLHKYPIDKSKLFNDSRKRILVFSLLFYIVFCLINIGLYFISINYLHSPHEMLRNYSGNIYVGYLAYSNPFVILATIFYFVFFSKLKIASRIINFYGKHILAVYLLTDNVIARDLLYGVIGFGLKHYSSKYILIAVLMSIGLILILPLIEFIRSSVYKWFYNRKISGKIRERIKLFFGRLGINW